MQIIRMLHNSYSDFIFFFVQKPKIGLASQASQNRLFFFLSLESFRVSVSLLRRSMNEQA